MADRLINKIAYSNKFRFQKKAYIIDAKILIAHDEEDPVATLVGKVSGKDDEYFEFGQAHVEKLDGSDWFENVYFFNKKISVFQAHRAVNFSVQRMGYAEDLIIALANYVHYNDNGFIGLFPTVSSSNDAIKTYSKLLQSNRLAAVEVFGLVPKKDDSIIKITDSHENIYMFTTNILSRPLPKEAYRRPFQMTKKSLERLSKGKFDFSFLDADQCIVTAGLLITGGVGVPSIPVETATMREIHNISTKSKPLPGFFDLNDIDRSKEEVLDRQKSFEKFVDRVIQIDKIRGG